VKKQSKIEQSNASQRLNTQISLMFFIGFVMLYIGSSYLQRSTLENLFSFYGSDGPGLLPNVVLPKPFGVHFFGDFLLPQWQSRLHDPWVFKDPTGPPITNYFPFTMAVFWLFSYISYWKSFLLFLVISLVLILHPLIAILKPRSRLERVQLIVGSVVFTGPMISLLDRGNIQLLLIGLCLMGVYQFSKGRYVLAAVLMGLAIGLKVYPILFLILFFRRHQWKALAVSLGTAVSSTVIPLIFYSGGIIETLHSIGRNVKINDSIYLRGYLCYNNSVKGSLITVESLGIPVISRLSTLTLTHFAIAAISLLMMSVFIFLNRNVPTGEILLVAAALMCSLATYVAPYVLGVFFVAILWLWKDSTDIPHWTLITYGWLLAILLMPRGLPLKFWNPDFISSSPTYTSLLGGPCCVAIIIVCFVRHANMKSLRGILRFDFLKNGPIIN
jgi:hypothetical protein